MHSEDDDMWEWFNRKFDIKEMEKEVETEEKNNGLREWSPTITGMYGDVVEVQVTNYEDGIEVGQETREERIMSKDQSQEEYTKKMELMEIAESLICG